jgi:hypothetical protein
VSRKGAGEKCIHWQGNRRRRHFPIPVSRCRSDALPRASGRLAASVH